jgi:hypothetical protein
MAVCVADKPSQAPALACQSIASAAPVRQQANNSSSSEATPFCLAMVIDARLVDCRRGSAGQEADGLGRNTGLARGNPVAAGAVTIKEVARA